eukprot:NODE_585_length_5683_cov_0.592586.p6 type:complete len:138 gc:universal NODE_585_length_5683_cov_0.592586:2258-1845(-)
MPSVGLFSMISPRDMWNKTVHSLIFKNKRFGAFKTKMGNTFKRQWDPNVQKKQFYSHVLGRYVLEDVRDVPLIKVSCATLRDIDNCGGIDGYLMTTPNRKLADSKLAMQLKHEIFEALTKKANDTDKEYLGQVNNRW